MKKISIKREQSQAGLSFAEREKFRPQVKNKLLLLLALLLTAATGAWAQTETLLLTIENSGYPSFTSGSKTFDDKVTVTFSKTVYNEGDTYGWYAATESLLTVAGTNGYTITSCKFYTNDGIAKTGYTVEGESPSVYLFGGGVYNDANQSEYLGDPGITKIEVYTAATGYTVSLKDGVKDAGKWTVKVGEGQAQALPIGGLKGDGSETVTLQYNGRLKVKGVKATSDAAAAAKEPATVTAAPTGAAIVGVGKTTALVSGGAAEGGTMMYKVTTENTKPASTDGFSATVPTAETITASGKVYVWYYVKGDDTHSDSEIAATAIEVPVADVVWDATNVTGLNVSGTYASYEKEGVTLSANAEEVYASWSGDGIRFDMMASGGYTFTAPTGKKFTKIEMKANGTGGWDMANLGSGWAFNIDWETYNFTVTWTGSAASAVGLLTGADYFQGDKARCIAFYLVDAE